MEHDHTLETLWSIAEKYRDKPISKFKFSKEDSKYYHAIYGYKDTKPDFYNKIMSIFKNEKEYGGETFFLNFFIDKGLLPEECRNKKCEFFQKGFGRGECTNRKKGEKCRPLKFDFYIPSYDVLVEYDGEQHFRPISLYGGESKFDDVIHNDFYKYEYVMKKNHRLIRIREKQNSLIDENILGNIVLNAIQNRSDKIILIQNYIRSNGQNGWINFLSENEIKNFIQL